MEFVEGKPLILLKWPGSDPSLPTILLNSHTDVVAKLTSKKSSPPAPSSVNSARVAGSVPPFPEHSIFPESQSPVTQENLPVESWEQWVQPQKRPPQEADAVMVLDSPFWSAKPVVDIAGTPALDRMPGHGP